MTIARTHLGNGMTIVSEQVPHLRSATVGVWVALGSRAESRSDNGIGHFIEHMLFKGTERRKAIDISREIESVGGTLNAYTEREFVFFFAKVLSRHFAKAADLLSDIFLNSLFEGDELERERDVVLQEILMVEDNPEEDLHDFFHESYWRGHPLGLPVQGTSDSVGSLTRDRVTSYYRDRFPRRGIVVSVVGDMEHGRAVEEFGSRFGDVRLGERHVPDPPPVPDSGVFLKRRPLEQVQLCLGGSSVHRTSPLRHAAQVLNAILGGSMSSRLFQEVREKRGLAYSIHSCFSAYADSGILKIYAGTTRDKAPELLKVAGGVVDELRAGGMTDAEVDEAKELIKGSMLLSLESAEYRMSRLAMGEMFFGAAYDHEEDIRRVDAVTTEDVRGLAAEILRRERFSLAALGDLPEASGLCT